MTLNAPEKTPPSKTKQNLPFRLGVVALGVIVFWLFMSLEGGNLLKTGTKAPDWTLDEPNSGRRMLSLNDLKGKVVVLDFWSLGCPPCMQMVPELDAVSRAFSENDVAVVGVAAWGESRNDVFRLKRGRKLDYHLLVGIPDVIKKYRVSSLPTLYIIDKKGEIAKRHQGFWPRNELTDAINDVLSD